MKSIDEIIYDPDLGAKMKTCNLLRRENNSDWYDIWDEIAPRIYEKQKEAQSYLFSFGVIKAEIHDGVVGGIEINAQDFSEYKSEIKRLLPNLKFLTIHNYSAVGGLFFDNELLKKIIALSLRGNFLTDLDMASLSLSPDCKNLCWLDIANNSITNQGLKFLAKSEHLSKLLFVNTSENSCDITFNMAVDEIDNSILESSLNDFGKDLQKAGKWSLHWLNSPKLFQDLYPPRMSDAAWLQSHIFGIINWVKEV